jgi:hypothetical protein
MHMHLRQTQRHCRRCWRQRQRRGLVRETGGRQQVQAEQEARRMVEPTVLVAVQLALEPSLHAQRKASCVAWS